MKHILTLTLLASAASVLAADITEKFDGKLWGHWEPAGCKVQYKKNLKEGIRNTPCAEIILLQGNPTNKFSCFLKKYPLTPGKQYQVVVMAKNATAGKSGTAALSLQAFNAKGKYASTIVDMKRKVNGEWLRLSCVFTVPKNIPTVQVLLSACGDAGSRILFDDFSIKELNPADPVVDHFDSASSVSFWKANGSKASMIFVDKEGKEAKGCVGISIPAGNLKNHGGSLLKRIPVVKGKEYTFLVQTKSSGFANDTKIHLNIQGQDSKMRFLGSGVQGTGIKAEDCRNWKQIAFTYKIPTTGKWAKCAYVLVTLSVSGNVPGQVLFDDFEYFINEEE